MQLLRNLKSTLLKEDNVHFILQLALRLGIDTMSLTVNEKFIEILCNIVLEQNKQLLDHMAEDGLFRLPSAPVLHKKYLMSRNKLKNTLHQLFSSSSSSPPPPSSVSSASESEEACSNVGGR
jgi:hypothetical protein